MPVPKKYQDKYGKIVGRMQNNGKSLEESKSIADKAVRGMMKENYRPKKKKQNGGKD